MMTNDGPLKGNIKLRLQTKFLISIVLIEALLLGAIILVVEQRMQASILDEFLKHGLSTTRSLAAVNSDFVTTYNYVKMDQHLEETLKEHGLLYAAVLLFDGEIASYKESRPVKDSVLSGRLHERALQAEDSLIQYQALRDEDFCEIVVPVFVNDQKWGTVRAGFLLTDMQAAVVGTRRVLLTLGGISLICGWLASIFLARRITHPVGRLVESVQAITSGEYHRPITTSTRDEIGYLGASFAVMQETLKAQFETLADTNLRLSTSNKRLQCEIAERRKKEKQIRYLAFYDSLTDLPNRALLEQYLSTSLRHAERHRRVAAVLFLDLDHFKRVNDTLGHHAGDELLRQAASRLVGCVRKCDYIIRGQASHPDDTPAPNDGNTVARLGGDEFVIVLTEIHCLEHAAVVAGRISQALAEPFLLGKEQIFVTSSIGISGYPTDGEDAETLLKHADAAMYHAKGQGRNGYQFYTTSMKAHIQERLSLEASLRDSLKHNHFMLHYQPKADTQTGQIVGMEALIRWQHPEKGFISPAQFIPIAEETGLIVPLGEWVLRTACAQNKAWQAAGLSPLRVAVNLSAVQFRQKDLPHRVTQVLQETGLAPEYLELELTESLLMENLDTSIALLDELKAIGMRLSIDDFGTGYSSLNYLKRFPIDTLKIDQTFVREIATDPDDAAIVTATIALGHNLRLAVIAEGVETEAQLELLRTHNCDEIQGYLLTKPLPPEAFVEYLQQNQRLPAKPPSTSSKVIPLMTKQHSGEQNTTTGFTECTAIPMLVDDSTC